MYFVVHLAYLNYVGKLLTDYVSGVESSFVFGTPNARQKDVQLTEDITHNKNVTVLNSKYAQKFGLKVQKWIHELTEGNSHKHSRLRKDGVYGQCKR